VTVSTSALDLERVSDRYFAAWQARDPDAIAALHTEDTQYWSHLGMEPIHGRAAVRETFAAHFEQFPNLGFTVYRVLFGAGHWVLDWKLTFDGPDGTTRGFDCVDVVEVSPDGLVTRKDTFIDFVQAQEQIK
jgi:hypothetical protein